MALPDFSGIIGFWLIFQVASSVISSLVMIYVMFCLGKTAASMDRLASAVERLVEHQTTTSLPQGRGMGGIAPSAYPPSGYGAPVPPPMPDVPSPPGSPTYAAPMNSPVPFTPGLPPTITAPTVESSSGTPANTSESEFSSGPNVPRIPRHEVRP